MSDQGSSSRADGLSAIDWDAIGRYLAGESSEAEAEAVRAWLATRPADAELLSRLDSAIARTAERPAPRVDVEAALRTVRARRNETPVVMRTLPREAPPPKRKTISWRVLGIPALAAAAAILIAVVALWRLSGVSEKQQPVPFAARTIETTVGQRDSLQLPDSSLIHVGPRSRLTVSAYSSDRREVNLEGAAFFDVKHDAARPFVVRTGNALVQDLGTAFLVEQIDSGGVRVVVTSGIVTLRAADVASDSATELREGDIGELQPPRRATVQRQSATPDDVAWTRGRLVFREASLERVRSELRRWYGVELRVVDQTLARRHLNAEFAGEAIDQVLRTIALSLGAEIELRGDTAIMRGVRRTPGQR